MVKKFLSVVAISSMVFATSCSNEDFDSPQVGGESLVSFTAQLPNGINSRAVYGDGTTAQSLEYAVYELNGEDWTNLTSLNGGKEIHLSTNVDLRLVNGKTYKVVFWASAGEDSPYAFDKGNATITANYEGIKSNDENLDAFYAVEEITVTEASSQTVKLRRPFAQLNIGTADLDAAEAAGLNITAAGITVSAHKEFSFKTQDVTDEATTVTFGNGALPTGQDFPVNGYEYLTMNYLLPAAEGEIVNVTLNYGGSTTATYANVPLKRNYRTNIYGNLTTSVEDFTVVIEPEFDGTNIVPFWDGNEMVAPAVEGNTYQISSAAEWAWVVAHGDYTHNAVLTNDINFYGHSVKQMAGLTGTFDGQGHTMSNLIVKSFAPNSTYSLGLFRGDGTRIDYVKNVTFKNITVENPDPVGVAEDNIYGYAGIIFGDIQKGNKTFENVVVDGCYVKGIVSVGGLAGLLASNATLTIKNCQVINSTITNYDVANESGYVAGLLGRNAHDSASAGLTLEGNIVSQGNTINGVYCTRRGAESIANVIGKLDGDALTAAYPGVTFSINNNLTATAQIEADVVIRSVADLQAFATSVSNGNHYAGKIVALASDLNLEGVEFHSIGAKLDAMGSSHVYFQGTFDGHGYTIKNMTINEETATGADCATGFFTWLNGGVVKNLNFENANVTGNHWVGSVVGYLQFGTVDNCKVNGSTVTSKYFNGDRDGDKAGGAIGFMGPNAEAKCNNCVVTNSHIYALRDAGQVVGMAYNVSESVTNCRAENVTVTAIEGGTGANIREELVGRVG